MTGDPLQVHVCSCLNPQAAGCRHGAKFKFRFGGMSDLVSSNVRFEACAVLLGRICVHLTAVRIIAPMMGPPNCVFEVFDD